MYEILCNNRTVGKASVKREGLYYHFYCECVLPRENIFKVFVTDGYNTVKLGVCVPDRGKYILNTRLPVKYLSGGILSFFTESNNLKKFLLRTLTLFDHLDKLETARLQYSDGRVYIIIS